jgi:hypothetical protein
MGMTREAGGWRKSLNFQPVAENGLMEGGRGADQKYVKKGGDTK